MLYGRLVHVGETFNRSADFGGCELRRPDSLAVIRRMGGREGKERVCNRDTVFVSGRK